MPVPLLKLLPDGTPYRRRPEIEKALTELSRRSRSEIGDLSKVTDLGDPGYIPSECLLHLIRSCRSDNSDQHFAALFQMLRLRVLARLPSPNLRQQLEGRELASHRNLKITEYVMDRFQDYLVHDRGGYDERLDYFEVNFDAAVATLRADGKKKANREERRSETIGYDDETSELNAEVEEAAAAQDTISDSKLDDPAYRSRLYAAIDSLPDNQRRVIELFLGGVQIDSQEPDVPTIVRLLNCAEKTVRNRRDRAYAAIRKALEEEKEA